LPKEISFDNVATHLMSDAYYELAACSAMEGSRWSSVG
jgi:hypothetical protein